MAQVDTLTSPKKGPDVVVSETPENPFLANFKPYVPASARMRELTVLPLIVGTLLGILFGASSLYLVLKVGLTVSASIPVAVLSITFSESFPNSGGEMRPSLKTTSFKPLARLVNRSLSASA